MSADFKELIDKKIINVYLNGVRDVLIFEDSNNILYSYECNGECCAISYIATFSNIQALLGEIIIKVDIKESKSEDTDDGVLDTCFYTISTNKGFIDFDLRTEHNGYYYGWIEYNPHLIIDLREFKKITEDF